MNTIPSIAELLEKMVHHHNEMLRATNEIYKAMALRIESLEEQLAKERAKKGQTFTKTLDRQLVGLDTVQKAAIKNGFGWAGMYRRPAKAEREGSL